MAATHIHIRMSQAAPDRSGKRLLIAFADLSAPAINFSTDLGAHWTEISNGRPGAASYEPVAIAVDPTDRDTVYMSIQDRGVYKSTDRGQTWATAGHAGPLVRRIAIDPTSPNRLLAATNGGLRMSTDGGYELDRRQRAAIQLRLGGL